MHAVPRRRFLWSLGIGGAFALAGGAWLGRHRGQTNKESPGSFRASNVPAITRTMYALGAEASVTVMHADPDAAGRALHAAVAELALVERLMSLYRPDSQISRLNREKSLRQPHPYLVQVLRNAQAMSQRSAGGFDVTVQPLWTLYAEAQEAGRLPGEREIAVVRRNIDWRQVEITSQEVRLRGSGTSITLNGIAQGFAADRVKDALVRHGIRHALVGTGELGSLGGKASGEPWTIGIQDPRNKDAYLALANLEGRSLSTSGDYQTRFVPDGSENHVFDPHTGHSPQTFASVSVAAATAAEADALSTALFVLGAERGLALLQSTPHADALLVFKDGRTQATPGFPLTKGTLPC